MINPKFLNAYNMQNLIKWSSLYAVMSIGVALVIITGGIDLSIGSVVGLVAVVLAFFLKVQGMDPWVAIGLTLCMSLVVGLIHGLLITKAHIQPFVVTLCGLLIYRSLSRWLTDNQSLGPVPLEGDKGYANLDQILGLDFIFSGKIPLGVLTYRRQPVLTGSSHCHRHLSAEDDLGKIPICLGNNEDGARYSGIDTDRMKIIAYVLCSFFAELRESSLPLNWIRFSRLRRRIL